MRGKNKAKYFFIHSVAQFHGNNKNWTDAMCRYQGEKKQNTEIINRQHVLLLLLFFLLLLLLFLVLLLLLLFFLAIVAVPQVVRVDAFVAVVVRDAAFVTVVVFSVVVGVAAGVTVVDTLKKLTIVVNVIISSSGGDVTGSSVFCLRSCLLVLFQLVLFSFLL